MINSNDVGRGDSHPEEEELRAQLGEAYATVTDRAILVDCEDHPCLAAVTGSSGVRAAGRLDRAERENNGLMWCGETINVGGVIPIVVVCYVDPATPDDELTHIAARVRSAADRLAAANYPRNRRARESCDHDTECTSLVCLPGEQVPECSGDRCCVERCIVDHWLCPSDSICIPSDLLESGFEYGPDDPPEVEPWLEESINALGDSLDHIAASHGACVLPQPARG